MPPFVKVIINMSNGSSACFYYYISQQLYSFAVDNHNGDGEIVIYDHIHRNDVESWQCIGSLIGLPNLKNALLAIESEVNDMIRIQQIKNRIDGYLGML